MKAIVAAAGIPNATTGGGALTAWSVIESLRLAGHEVAACVLDLGGPTPSAARVDRQLSDLRRISNAVHVVTLDERVREPQASCRLSRRLSPRIDDYLPSARLAAPLESIIGRESADVVFAYHFEPLAALYRTKAAPIVGAVGDPLHAARWFQWRSAPVRLGKSYAALTFDTAIAMWRLPTQMARMLTACRAAGAFASHHASWFRDHGVPTCQYFRTPVVDVLGSQPEARRAPSGSRPFKILLVGHLKGTATLSGMYNFAREVLPRLEASLKPGQFEVHVVGGYDPPPELGRLLDRPSVRMRGQVEPATEEFLSCDVLVVPTPIRLGIRVRILTGLSFGCTIVAHAANRMGIPELRDRENALLADTGAGLAAAILETAANPTLRQALGREARRTYEEYFAPASAGGAIARVVVEAAGG